MPEYEFTEITGLGRSGERWFAFDRLSNELRFYGDDGRFAGRTGRSGSGPGEFRNVYYAATSPSSSIFVYDQVLQRLTKFTSDGELVRSWQGPFARAAGFMQPQGIVDDETLVWSELRMPSCEVGESTPDTLAYYLHTLPAAAGGLRSGRSDDAGAMLDRTPLSPLGGWPNRMRWGSGITGRCFRIVIPFTSSHASAVHNGRLYLTSSQGFEISVVDLVGDHGTTMIRGPEGRRSALPARMIANYEASLARAGTVDEAGRPLPVTADDAARQVRRMYGEMPYPDSLPLVARLVVDADDHIWVRLHVPDGDPDTWVILDPSGRIVTEMTMSGSLRHDRLRIVEIGTDYVAGVHTGASGVETIRIHSLVRPASR